MTAALKAAVMSPTIMIVPLTVVGGLIVILTLIILGFRSLRLDDLKEQTAEIVRQRGQYTKLMDDASAERGELKAILKEQDKVLEYQNRALENLEKVHQQQNRVLDRLEQALKK